MKKPEPKQIDADMKLRAFALFTLAKHHYLKCREIEASLAEMLGYPDAPADPYMGCLSDEIYDDRPSSNFERGMRDEGFVVAKKKPARKRA